MAAKQILMTIFRLFLLLLLVSNGATYRIHHFALMNSNRNKHNTNTLTTTAFSHVLPNAMQIPPSGPSKRHNRDDDGLAKPGSKV
ncbi:hypothetical protein SLEP1_g19240 [Rubroshorea leprosula]|nr:hypothetical protein SLEP1_g19240 [Rubroshorea leprosula]